MLVVKVKGGSSLDCVLVRPAVFGFFVHWLGKRSFVCPGMDCAACFAGVGAKWSGVVPIRWEGRQDIPVYTGLLELSQIGFERLELVRRENDLETLLGMRCVFARAADRSPMRVSLADSGALKTTLKAELPQWLVCDAVATLYGLPACPNDDAIALWESEVAVSAARLIRTALPEALEAARGR